MAGSRESLVELDHWLTLVCEQVLQEGLVESDGTQGVPSDSQPSGMKPSQSPAQGRQDYSGGKTRLQGKARKPRKREPRLKKDAEQPRDQQPEEPKAEEPKRRLKPKPPAGAGAAEQPKKRLKQKPVDVHKVKNKPKGPAPQTARRLATAVQQNRPSFTPRLRNAPG